MGEESPRFVRETLRFTQGDKFECTRDDFRVTEIHSKSEGNPALLIPPCSANFSGKWGDARGVGERRSRSKDGESSNSS